MQSIHTHGTPTALQERPVISHHNTKGGKTQQLVGEKAERLDLEWRVSWRYEQKI